MDRPQTHTHTRTHIAFTGFALSVCVWSKNVIFISLRFFFAFAAAPLNERRQQSNYYHSWSGVRSTEMLNDVHSRRIASVLVFHAVAAVADTPPVKCIRSLFAESIEAWHSIRN